MTLWPGYTRPPGHSPGDRAAGGILSNTNRVTLALVKRDMTNKEFGSNRYKCIPDFQSNFWFCQDCKNSGFTHDITKCWSPETANTQFPAIHDDQAPAPDWRWPDTCQLRTELPWLRTEDKVTRLLLFPHNLLLSLNCCNANIVTQHNNQTWLVVIVHIDLNCH